MRNKGLWTPAAQAFEKKIGAPLKARQFVYVDGRLHRRDIVEEAVLAFPKNAHVHRDDKGLVNVRQLALEALS